MDEPGERSEPVDWAEVARRCAEAVSANGGRISTRSVCAMSRRLPGSPVLDRSRIFRDEKLHAFLADMGVKRRAPSRRRKRAPSHIRAMTRMELAQKLVRAGEKARQNELQLAFLQEAGHDDEAVTAPVAAARNARNEHPLWRSRRGSGTTDRDGPSPSRALYEKALKGLGPETSRSPTAVALSSGLHVSTVARLMQEDAADAVADRTSYRAVIPPAKLARALHGDLAEALELERAYIKAMRAAIGALGARMRRDAAEARRCSTDRAVATRHAAFERLGVMIEAGRGGPPPIASNDAG